jgi:hypothetical protein
MDSPSKGVHSNPPHTHRSTPPPPLLARVGVTALEAKLRDLVAANAADRADFKAQLARIHAARSPLAALGSPAVASPAPAAPAAGKESAVAMQPS